MVRGVGSWREVADMSLPQVKACLRECDRRDAALALSQMSATHAAVAPVMVGDEGGEVAEKIKASFRRVINPDSDRTDSLREMRNLKAKLKAEGK